VDDARSAPDTVLSADSGIVDRYAPAPDPQQRWVIFKNTFPRRISIELERQPSKMRVLRKEDETKGTARPTFAGRRRAVAESWCSFALLGKVGTQSGGKDAVEYPIG
jgi:hypothetical protein